MDMPTFYKHAEADKALVQSLKSLDPALVDAYVSTLTSLFRQVVAQEHKNPKQFEALKQAFAATAKAAMRHLDDSGVTGHVARHAHELAGVSFAQSAPMLGYEAACLYRLGVPHDKVARLWPWLDQIKAAAVPVISAPGFRLEPLVDATVASFGHETGGEPWMHLSPGFWMHMSGYVLGIANCVLEVPTAGLATASIITGAIAVAQP
jgi:hypothetical protein